MKILSIDVGIKNLAFCILETTEKSNFIIRYWDVINLCNEKNHICEFNIKNKKNFHQCNKEAKYHKNDHFFCKTHASKTEFKLPTSELNKYKRLKIDDLQQIISEYEISILGGANKTNLIKHVENYIEKHVFEPISAMKCNEFSLIDIGIAIRDNLDKLETFIFSNIDFILIENQISPIANRMNCIQGMLSQYFIMKQMNNIKFISAANKLKPFIGNRKTKYCERKKMSIEITKKLLPYNDDNNINKDKITDMFNKHKKKDDLADCFLQGIWYLLDNSKIELPSFIEE
tara:strand:+ start:4841 stop:5704 length:864 start_codon:yes stop_codon:yes gene_type:complete